MSLNHKNKNIFKEQELGTQRGLLYLEWFKQCLCHCVLSAQQLSVVAENMLPAFSDSLRVCVNLTECILCLILASFRSVWVLRDSYF